jgi:hypothetical protein
MLSKALNLSIVVKLPNVDLHLLLVARPSSCTQAISAVTQGAIPQPMS